MQGTLLKNHLALSRQQKTPTQYDFPSKLKKLKIQKIHKHCIIKYTHSVQFCRQNAFFCCLSLYIHYTGYIQYTGCFFARRQQNWKSLSVSNLENCTNTDRNQKYKSKIQKYKIQVQNGTNTNPCQWALWKIARISIGISNVQIRWNIQPLVVLPQSSLIKTVKFEFQITLHKIENFSNT